VVITSDLDCTIPGTYFMDFNVADAAGNKAPTMRRTINVVLDKTPPVLTLNGANPYVIEQCGTYTEFGATAVDGTDGNLNTAIKITGMANTNATGTYEITYTVADVQGNSISKVRTVQVVDTKKPHISLKGQNIVNNAIIPVQIGSVFVDEVYAEDECNGFIAINKTPGFNGLVNTLIRATYPQTYNAKDPSGNDAFEDGFVLNYRVDDFISPEISLNTADTILHDVNLSYSSQQVSVFDNYYPTSKVSVTKTGSVNPFKLGVYSETYTAIDGSGNSATRTRYIKVVDREAPKIVTSTVNVCAGDPFWAMSGVNVSDNYYSEDALIPLVKILDHNINIWRQGLYYINYQVADPSGNKSQVVMRPVWVRYQPDCESTFLSTDNADKNAFTVFPNPASDRINIAFAKASASTVQVQIFSLTGNMVHTASTEAGAAGLVIDTKNLSNGTYMLKLVTNGEISTQKIVINK
jgi:hypothetical protein